VDSPWENWWVVVEYRELPVSEERFSFSEICPKKTMDSDNTVPVSSLWRGGTWMGSHDITGSGGS
jgi:hypothetical protein